MSLIDKNIAEFVKAESKTFPKLDLSKPAYQITNIQVPIWEEPEYPMNDNAGLNFYCTPPKLITREYQSQSLGKQIESVDTTLLQFEGTVNLEAAQKDFDTKVKSAPPLASIYQKNLPNYPIDSRPSVSSLDGNQLKYLTVEMKDFTSSAEIIEPIIISCFLYDLDLKQHVSETWRIVPKSLHSLPNCKELISNSIINAPNSVSFPFTTAAGHNRIIFVASLDRLLVKDGGQSLEKYIAKASSSTKKNAQEDIKKCNQKDTSQTFAWCYSGFAELIPPSESGLKHLNTFIPCSTLDNDFLTKELANITKSKDKVYPFTLSLNVYAHDCGSKKLQHFYSFAHASPYLTFQNKLFLNLKEARFKKPRIRIRNVVIHIKILADGKPLNLFSGSDTYVSRVHYHEERPNFHDEALIVLPLQLPPKVMIEFTIYHASVKPGAAAPLEPCGKAEFPLFENDAMIADGDHEATINYGTDIPADQSESHKQGNHILFSTELFSSCFSSNSIINRIMRGEIVKEAPPIEALNTSIFAVLDTILMAIENDKEDAFDSLMEILSNYKKERDDPSNQNLIFYVAYCAFRWQSKDFYKHLAAQWLKYIENDPKNNKRTDISAAWFLFDLIIKSLAITTNKHELGDIITLCGHLTDGMEYLRLQRLAAGKSLNKYMAMFIKDIIEISSRSIGFQILAKHIGFLKFKELFDKECFRDLLPIILTPKIFLFSLVKINDNETFFDKYFVDQIAKVLDSEKFANLTFHTLFDLLSQFDNKQHQFIFKKLFNLLNVICSKVDVFNQYEYKYNYVYIFAVAQYILSYILQDGTIQHKPEWCNIISFMLTNAKHFTGEDKTKMLNDYAKRDEEDLTNNMLSHITQFKNSGSISKQTGSRRFASLKMAKTTDNIKRPHEQQQILTIFDALTFGIQTIALNFLDKYNSIGIVNNILVIFFDIELSPYLQCDYLNFINRFIMKDTKKENFLLKDPRSNLKHIIMRIIKHPTSDNIKILTKIKECEQSSLGNCMRTNILLSRAFGKIPPTDKHIELMTGTPFEDFVKKLHKINTDLTPELKSKNPDTYADLLYQKAELLKDSPDIQIEILLQLHEHQLQHQYKSEAVMAQLCAAAIVAEYMYHFKKIPEEFFRTRHPVRKFAVACPVAAKFEIPDSEINNLPNIRGYCSSKYFTEFGLIYLIQTAMETCKAVALFELSTRIHSLLSPIAQYRSLWRVLQNHYMTGQISWQIASNMSTANDRNLGAYYKVEYPDHGVFIYRETNLTNLWAVCNKLQKASAYYAAGKEVVCVTEGQELNKEKFNDPNKYYVHVKHLTQYFTPEEHQKRLTAFEQNHNISQFYFDVPFSKDAQATLENCYLKRTIFTLTEPLPFLVARVKVAPENIKEIIFSPIEYAVQNIQGQVSKIREACNRVRNELKDLATKEALHGKKQNVDMNTVPSFKELQPLIQGSLLVQVNEGPEKMAQVFLNRQAPDERYAQHQDMLRQIFREFLTANDEAVTIHGEMVVKLPVYSVLQEELVLGLSKLTSKLQQFLK